MGWFVNLLKISIRLPSSWTATSIWPSMTGKPPGMSSSHSVMTQQVAQQVTGQVTKANRGPPNTPGTPQQGPCLWAPLQQPPFCMNFLTLSGNVSFDYLHTTWGLTTVTSRRHPLNYDPKAMGGGCPTLFLGENNHMPSLLSKTCDSNAKPLLGFSNAKNLLCTDNSNLRMSSWEHTLEFSLVGKHRASLRTEAAQVIRADWIWCPKFLTLVYSCWEIFSKFHCSIQHFDICPNISQKRQG